MTPPFMAQGMGQGLRDAQNLAWKLERVLKGESSAVLLDSYAEERRPHVVETTLVSIELGRVICERDTELARRRDERMLAEQGGEVRTSSRQNMIPPLKHGLIAGGSPGAGTLFPQPDVRSVNAEGRLDDLTGGGIRVAVVGELDAEGGATLQELLRSCGGTLIRVDAVASTGTGTGVLSVEEVEPVMAPWLASLGRSIAIARPDNYAYATADSAGEALVLLEELLRRLRD